MYSIYGFEPSQPLAIIAAVLFGVGAITHTIQMIRYKTKFFTSFTIGAYMMTIGYAARFISARNPSNIPIYALQNLFIILPPSLYAATLYMMYGRITLLVNQPQASIIRPTLVTKLFVCGDVVSFLTQAGGGGMMVMASKRELGENLEIFGLGLQLVFFGFFLIVAITFRVRMRGVVSEAAFKQHGRYSWETLLNALFVAAVLIIIRCVYRMVEFTQGYSGYLMHHEAYAYVLDALPMLFVQTMFNVVHAGQVFPKPGYNEDIIEEYIKLDPRK